jgi:hypothetical protein
MTPQIAFRLPLFESGTLLESDRGYLKGIHPLADGTAVIHLSTYSHAQFSTSLLRVGNGSRQVLPVPEAVSERVRQCREDEATRLASYGAPISFRVGERVGLLVTDRWAWLFDPSGDVEPIEIAIDPLPWASGITGQRSYIPVRAGVSNEARVPIILRHPDARDDYPAFLATIEFDLPARTARWNATARAQGPATVPYRVDPDDFNGLPEYAGTTLGDAAWLGDRLRVFTMGNRTHYGRMGMPYASALETDIDGANPRCLRDIGESSHGLFSPDGRHLLLLPFFKSGPRKGKPSLLDLDAGTELPLSVRGLAAYRPLAYRDGCMWFAGRGSWSDWDSLVLDEGKPGELVACRMD